MKHAQECINNCCTYFKKYVHKNATFLELDKLLGIYFPPNMLPTLRSILMHMVDIFHFNEYITVG